MDFDQYVAARYGRLVEHAVQLGCAEGEAHGYVDSVLVDQRRRIRKAEDPDPLVKEALEWAISGPPERRSRTGPLVALGLVVVAIAVVVALTHRPPPDPMPSLFALEGDQAAELLLARGYDVVVREVRTCEPPGLVVGSQPPAGGPVREGATVTVRTSVLSGSHCEPAYVARSAAWEFVQFALGSGPAPEFTRTVDLVIDGGYTVALSGPALAMDHRRLGGIGSAITKAAAKTAHTDSGMPLLWVRSTVPPTQWCGIDRPNAAGERGVLRVEIGDVEDGNGCPLTIDLYRTSSDEIDAVVLYNGR